MNPNLSELFLCGPGRSISNLNLNNNDSYFCYGNGAFKYFWQEKFSPNFFYFFDPNAINFIFNDLCKDESYTTILQSKCTLILHDFHDHGFFYEEGYTTVRGQSWYENQFHKNILPKFKSFFKDILIISPKNIYPTKQSRNIFLNDSFFLEYKGDYPFIIRHKPKTNNDKFSTLILPIIFSYFKKIKSIKSIGFGDFNEPRFSYSDNSDIRHYTEYKRSFNHVSLGLYDLFKRNNINIDFINTDSYYNIS